MFRKYSLCSVLLVAFLANYANCKDDYVVESQHECETSNDFFSCAKVRVLKYVTSYTVPIDDDSNTTSIVKLVKINEGVQGSNEDNVSSTARFLSSDNESVKFLKFLQRQANTFLNHQGLSIPFPDGARLIDFETGDDLVEVGRKKKFGKKASMLIPILILFKLFKVKVLVALALAGIFFIKKVILVGALVLPTLIHGLKTACKHQLIPHHHHVDDHHDSGLLGGFGAGDYGGGYYGQDQPKGGWERHYYTQYNKPQ